MLKQVHRYIVQLMSLSGVNKQSQAQPDSFIIYYGVIKNKAWVQLVSLFFQAPARLGSTRLLFIN